MNSLWSKDKWSSQNEILRDPNQKDKQALYSLVWDNPNPIFFKKRPLFRSFIYVSAGAPQNILRRASKLLRPPLIVWQKRVFATFFRCYNVCYRRSLVPNPTVSLSLLHDELLEVQLQHSCERSMVSWFGEPLSTLKENKTTFLINWQNYFSNLLYIQSLSKM